MQSISRAKTMRRVQTSLGKTTNATVPMTTLVETVLKRLFRVAQAHVLTMVHV